MSAYDAGVVNKPDLDTLLVLPQGKAETIGPQRLEAIVEALGGRERVHVETPSTLPGVPESIIEWSATVPAVAIGGGDGTMRAAASALMETGVNACILPLGTANDFARTLGVATDPVKAAQLRRHGRVEDVDVGEVNGHAFFNAAGVGLNVDVTDRLARGGKRFGAASYALALIDVVRMRRSFRAEMTCDGDFISLRSVQVSIGNGRRHGGGALLGRDASVDDGWLDAYSLPPLSAWRLASHLPAFLRGTQAGWKHVTTLRGREMRLETPGKSKRVNADGDVVTKTPASFRLHRNAVNVFLPSNR